MIHDYEDQAVLIGGDRSLVGVLSRPKGRKIGGSPAIVILNTGIIHRIGHYRMYVTLARQLAAAGHVVLRFDFSGIGDSDRRPSSLNPFDACLSDTKDALDWLEKSGNVDGAVIVGLCSGADIALRFGAADRRVVGLVLLDPTVPPTKRFYRDYVFRRIARPKSWLTFLMGRGRIWGDLARRAAVAVGLRAAVGGAVVVDPLNRHELENLYRSIVDRDAHLLVALTGEKHSGRQTYREQFLDALPTVQFADKLRLEFFADSDHTFSREADRDRLNVLIKEWLSVTRPPPSSS